ncbi:MAG TPA: ABC transporter permease, partial [Desulfuromonadales bacterium]|nr:ABC transporter permease [Desulfuromonadales bacterium]
MEVTGIIDLRLSDLFLVYGLVILAIGLGRLQQVGQGKEILIASVRMVFQLLAVGYVLKAVFTLRTPAPI